jgi:ubiquinone/menaquinone biosynthesis C-methylase UbiE
VVSLLRAVRRRLVERRTTFYIRQALDEWLPPVIREFAPFNRVVGRLFHGPNFDPDFKRRAFHMSRAEFARSYAVLTGGMARSREADTTPDQLEAILGAAVGSVLDVGCGNGMIARRLRERGHSVVGVDITAESVRSAIDSGAIGLRAALPELPFRDGSFDTVVCSHTLEHIPDIWSAAAELRRVARRVVAVVPRQRYARYTFDYHLHFFQDAEPLEYLLGGTARLVDGDWFIVTSS